MAKPQRHRCLTVGCNPKLKSLASAEQHRDATGHRIAKWPVRSAEGRRRAKARNRSGYYDKYNTGRKSPEVRGYGKYGPYDPWDPYEERSFTGFESMYEDGWHENS